MIIRFCQKALISAMSLALAMTSLVTTVNAEEPQNSGENDVRIVLSDTSLQPATNTSLQLKATVEPKGSSQKVIWKSSDESVATVSASGKVDVKKYGNAFITATLADDELVKAFCSISPRFYDVNDTGKYYYKPVYWAADNGITTGYDKVYFGPQRNCTRRELSIFLWRLAGKPYAEGNLPFKDTGKYAETTDSYKAILWCYTAGIVKGYGDGTFRPDNSIVRKDTMIMLYRLADRPAVTGTMKFPDVIKLGLGPTTDTYRSIIWGTELGITKGYSDGSFKPNDNCLREHIVTFIYRYAVKDLTEEEKTDKDTDTVPDYLEEYFGSDPAADDTDGDGVPDHEEIYLTWTDPDVVDSDGNGIDDGYEDYDGDGLINLEEVQIGTNPAVVDSDADGLTDYDEIYVYGTDPTKYDTDGDGISDYDEIQLGLNPETPATNGTPDGEVLIEQVLDEEYIPEELLEDNPVVPSVSGNVPGSIASHVTVSETAIPALEDNRAVVGRHVLVETDYLEGADLQLNFSFDPEDSRAGFYLICRYEDGDLIPVETVQYEDHLSAQVSEGRYVVVDAEQLLVNLDIPIRKYASMDTSAVTETEEVFIPAEADDIHANDVPEEWYAENYISTAELAQAADIENTAEQDSAEAEETAEPVQEAEYVLISSLKGSETASPDAEAPKISGQADIVFVIDTTGSMSGAINNVVRNIDAFVDELQASSVKVNFALVDYKDITCSEPTVLVMNGSSPWFDDVTAFKAKINALYVTGGGDGPETPIDALAMAEQLTFRQNANKFIILVTDANYKNDNNYGISDMNEMTSILKQDGIVTSVISNTSYEGIYHNLYTETGGVFGNINGDFKSVLMTMAENIEEIVNDGSWVILSDYQFIKLGQPLDPVSSFSSDDDSISDADELGKKTTKDVKPFIDWVLKNYDIPEGMYDDPTTVDVYEYVTNPVLEDTDYDGKLDDKDACPRSNFFGATLKTDYSSGQVSGYMDYRWFNSDSTVYNPKLSRLSLLMSSAIYSGNSLSLYDSAKEDQSASTAFKDTLAYFGMKNAKTESISASDNHKSEVGVGYHTAKFGKVSKTVVAVTVRGTNGTTAEWASNFDIGDYDTIGAKDWETSYNHKGFDIAANRIMDIVDDFIADNRENEDFNENNIVYWVTGHSRGAAIANIIGAYYENAGKKAFTYTFASPNTTMAGNVSTYRSIFNIVNSDDFVPCLPMSAWGYSRYGRTAKASIKNSYEKQWEEFTDIWDYDPDTFGMDDTVNSLGKILDSGSDARVECYKYTCDDHGDGSSDNITITNRGTSKDSREGAIAKIPANALPYCIITRHDGFLIAGWDFDVCQTPAYFMQILAAKMAGDIGNYRFVTELNIADRYEDAKSHIIRSAIGGLQHPHYTESYYILASYIGGSSFK